MPTYMDQNCPGTRDWKIVFFIFEMLCLLTYFSFLHSKLMNSKTWLPSLCMSGKTKWHNPFPEACQDSQHPNRGSDCAQGRGSKQSLFSTLLLIPF